MWFIAWQLWKQRRASISAENYEFASQGHRLGNIAYPLEVAKSAREANGAPARFLTVSNFTAADLDVRTSGHPSVEARAGSYRADPASARYLPGAHTAVWYHQSQEHVRIVHTTSAPICRRGFHQRTFNGCLAIIASLFEGQTELSGFSIAANGFVCGPASAGAFKRDLWPLVSSEAVLLVFRLALSLSRECSTCLHIGVLGPRRAHH